MSMDAIFCLVLLGAACTVDCRLDRVRWLNRCCIGMLLIVFAFARRRWGRKRRAPAGTNHCIGDCVRVCVCVDCVCVCVDGVCLPRVRVCVSLESE